ncbi:hypothetical protein [Bacteroides hominis]|uniref:hypothetical protein n=1 Tax=Bacteroides hominis TaxID=2763023 RepID=UPI00301020ED
MKQLKSEVAVLERKIQLELKPPEKQVQTAEEDAPHENISLARPMKTENKGIRI